MKSKFIQALEQTINAFNNSTAVLSKSEAIFNTMSARSLREVCGTSAQELELPGCALELFKYVLELFRCALELLNARSNY